MFLASGPTVDSGNTAWLLISSALVLLMTPGVAFFYGGMVRSKNILNMLMMSTVAMGVVTIVWVLYGFSGAFGSDKAGIIGSLNEFFGLRTLISGDTQGNGSTIALIPSANVPTIVFVMFQLTFAIITVALISGAVADRMKFSAWVLFTFLWSSLVYVPVCHWVFSGDGVVSAVGGWINSRMHVVDFAGGTAVHINAGIAGLILAILVGKRRGFPTVIFKPHNLPWTMLGAGLLWFGWYGFNSGSALTAGSSAGSVAITTTVATAAAMLAWLLVERIRDGHPTSLGAASGIVAGLVAITPSCSSVDVLGAIVIGAVAGAICSIAVSLKYRFGFDDSLDVVGVHLIGGIIGTLLIGFFARPGTSSVADPVKPGLFYGGGFTQLGRQFVGVIAVTAYCLIVTSIIALIIKYTIGLRLDQEAESMGADESQHAESAYDFVGGGVTTTIQKYPV